jgi:hypothetical protein
MDEDQQETQTELPPINQMSEAQRTMRSPSSESAFSPIRPQNPDKPKLMPSLAKPTKPVPPVRSTTTSQPVTDPLDDSKLSPAEKAEQALQLLREKIDKLTAEHDQGVINQAQFEAIYKRYIEQRQITELLLERNPGTEAWAAVVQAGHTTFLRDHFAAKIISYGIYHLRGGEPIILQGKVRLPQNQLGPVLNKIINTGQQGHLLSPAARPLKDGSWVFIIPGRLSASVVIYSSEPAPMQRKKAEEAHYDFERANEKMLQREDYTPEALVYPHRALLEALPD